jgi:hypothetical protein
VIADNVLGGVSRVCCCVDLKIKNKNDLFISVHDNRFPVVKAR